MILPRHRRIVLLTGGRLGVFSAKTAAALLRYRAADIVGVVDETQAGADIRSIVPWSPAVPIVAEIRELEGSGPDALYVGVAPVGGELPASMRAHIVDALRLGVDIVSGLHEFLQEDAELAALAARHGARIYDVRRPPSERRVASAAARDLPGRRVLTVGTDANVGKMTAALELHASAVRRGIAASFIATGQTGIMIAAEGVCVDAVVSDFAAGAVEAALLDAGEADLYVVEGQGSLGHPGFSGVTLSLLHGACPDVLVLVHHAGRTRHRADPGHPLPTLEELCRAYEAVAGLLHPARLVGAALNTTGADDATIARETGRLRALCGGPVVDVLREGADALLDAVLGAPLRRAARGA